MARLTKLIEEARSRKGLDVFFNTEPVSHALNVDEPTKKASISMMSTLDELEVQLFPCLHLTNKNVDDIIQTLEGVLDNLSE
jgi:hypothetical protein